MQLEDFHLERYFAEHEFAAKYLLSCSDCDGLPLRELLAHATNEERHEWENIHLGYTESQGMPELREQIAGFYESTHPNQVVVASPGELNFSLMNLLLGPGDHCISVSPCYQSLAEVARSAGASLSFWEPDPLNWQFNVEDLENLIQDNTKLLVINFPHNPTGAYLTESELREVVDFARRHDLHLFSDEMYYRLQVGELPALSPVSDLYEKGISLWGTSKSFGLAGLRVGWLVSKNQELIDQVVSFKDYLSICNAPTNETLARVALGQADRLIQMNIEKIQKNMQIFSEYAKDSDLIERFIPPAAGSTAFVKLNISGSAKSFSDELVTEHGIMTVPAEMFGFEGPYIRLGFGRRNFPQGLEQLKKFEGPRLSS